LTSQLDEAKEKLSLSSSQLNEFKDKLSLSSSQLNEARNQSSEVEKNYKLLSGDHDALSNISLEQCDELILTLIRSQEKLQQRRVSDEPTIFAFHI
jgi:chromosome segregation ATPase